MALHSKLTTKSQTTIPLVVREHLKIGPGSELEYELREDGVFIRPKAVHVPGQDDPFATFAEWSSKNDENAYADL